MNWTDMIKLEPMLKTLKQLAKDNPDSNRVRQLIDNYAGLYARKPELSTTEAYHIALKYILPN